jgi:hypothetical protein
MYYKVKEQPSTKLLNWIHSTMNYNAFKRKDAAQAATAWNQLLYKHAFAPLRAVFIPAASGSHSGVGAAAAMPRRPTPRRELKRGLNALTAAGSGSDTEKEDDSLAVSLLALSAAPAAKPFSLGMLSTPGNTPLKTYALRSRKK